MLAVLTAVLVAITGYYAWQTRQTVLELRRSRELALRPHLTLYLEPIDPTYCVFAVMNAGVGPAFDVRVEISFHGVDPTATNTRQWRGTVLAPSRRVAFYAPDKLSMDGVAERYPRATARGAFRDALGIEHVVDEELDVRGDWQLMKDALQRFDRPPLERLAGESRKISKALEKLAGR